MEEIQANLVLVEEMVDGYQLEILQMQEELEEILGIMSQVVSLEERLDQLDLDREVVLVVPVMQPLLDWFLVGLEEVGAVQNLLLVQAGPGGVGEVVIVVC